MRKRKKIWFAGLALLVIGLLYLAFLQFKIAQFSHSKAPSNADYIIVLGAKVNGTVPSLALKARIAAAAEYLKENPSTIAIASGGKGPGEDISEAESIQNGLIHHGISKSRIILEKRSTSTDENIRFSKKLIPENAGLGVVVTNNFHIYRSLAIAKDYGLHLYGLAAITPRSAIIKSYIHEYLAITKYYLLKMLD